jgi:hypothetical protein
MTRKRFLVHEAEHFQCAVPQRSWKSQKERLEFPVPNCSVVAWRALIAWSEATARRFWKEFVPTDTVV